MTQDSGHSTQDSSSAEPALIPDAAPVPPPAPGPGLVTAGRLAAELRVSTTSIWNWNRDGMGADGTGRGGPAGGPIPLYDLERCRAWAHRNRPALFGAMLGRGGHRAGAGRPPGRKDKRKRRARGSGGGGGSGEGGGGGGGGGGRAAGRDAQGTLLPLGGGAESEQRTANSEHQGEDKGGESKSQGRGFTEARTRSEELRQRKMELDIQLREGLLIKREEVEKTWGGFLSVLKDRLETIPGKCATELMSVLRIGGEDAVDKRMRAEELIGRELAVVLVELVRGAEGSAEAA